MAPSLYWGAGGSFLQGSHVCSSMWECSVWWVKGSRSGPLNPVLSQGPRLLS